MSKIFQQIFSIKNEKVHKVITILGLKLKFKSKFLTLQKNLSDLKKEVNERLSNQKNIIKIQSENINVLKENVKNQTAKSAALKETVKKHNEIKKK